MSTPVTTDDLKVGLAILAMMLLILGMALAHDINELHKDVKKLLKRG